jgi:hypothetical protein
MVPLYGFVDRFHWFGGTHTTKVRVLISSYSLLKDIYTGSLNNGALWKYEAEGIVWTALAKDIFQCILLKMFQIPPELL